MKPRIDFERIAEAIRDLELPRFDLVVGIGRGGVVPASLLAYKLECRLAVVHINYRDDGNAPQHDAPRILEAVQVPAGVTRILVVDDVSVTGSTLRAASSMFDEFQITTLVLKGKADFVVFPELASCVEWPWSGGTTAGRDSLVDEVPSQTTRVFTT